MLNEVSQSKNKGLETFPADVKELRRENFVEGWNQIIGTSLKEFVKKE